MKFLVDECLSPELAKRGIQAGHGESSHITWLKLSGRKDWELKPIIIDGDWTFVTKNSVDFRGPRENPGSKGPLMSRSMPDSFALTGPQAWISICSWSSLTRLCPKLGP
jgi:hypothetical protein